MEIKKSNGVTRTEHEGDLPYDSVEGETPKKHYACRVYSGNRRIFAINFKKVDFAEISEADKKILLYLQGETVTFTGAPYMRESKPKKQITVRITMPHNSNVVGKYSVDILKEISIFGEKLALHYAVDFTAGRFFQSDKWYSVSHVETGVGVGPNLKTRSLTIEKALAAINFCGEEKFKKAINFHKERISKEIVADPPSQGV